jgi:hypothetical protein
MCPPLRVAGCLLCILMHVLAAKEVKGRGQVGSAACSSSGCAPLLTVTTVTYAGYILCVLYVEEVTNCCNL